MVARIDLGSKLLAFYSTPKTQTQSLYSRAAFNDLLKPARKLLGWLVKSKIYVEIAEKLV